MKREEIEKYNKRDYSIRTIHKRSIQNALVSSSRNREGLTRKEIHSKVNFISSRTVSNLLKEMESEKRVFKSGKKYYLYSRILSLFFGDDWSIFSEYLHECQRTNQLFDIIPDPQTISWSTNSLEHTITQFSSKLGPIITYILMESLRPTKELMPVQERVKFCLDFINEAISIPDILNTFLSSLPENITRKTRTMPELQELTFEEVTGAYQNVYPDVYKMIEEGYRIYTSIEELEGCSHDWQKINIHKIGKRYECKKCKTIKEKLAG